MYKLQVPIFDAVGGGGTPTSDPGEEHLGDRNILSLLVWLICSTMFRSCSVLENISSVRQY